MDSVRVLYGFLIRIFGHFAKLSRLLTQPEASGFDLVAKCLFVAWQIIAIEHCTHFVAAPLVDHPFDRIVLFQQLLDLVGRCDFFESCHLRICSAGLKQG
mgnify:CR=1 FL=1